MERKERHEKEGGSWERGRMRRKEASEKEKER